MDYFSTSDCFVRFKCCSASTQRFKLIVSTEPEGWFKSGVLWSRYRAPEWAQLLTVLKCGYKQVDPDYHIYVHCYVGEGDAFMSSKKGREMSQHGSRRFLLHSLINTQSSTSLSGNSIYRGFVQEEWVLLAPRPQASPIAFSDVSR